MTPHITSILAFSLLVIGIVTVSFTFILHGRNNAARHPGFLRRAHRIAGYIFLALYLFVCAVMFKKLTNNFGVLSARDAIHAYLGIVILPMIIAKICIVRFYRKYYQRLSVYGMIIMITVYMTVTLSAGHYTLSTIRSRYAVLLYQGMPVKVNLNAGRKVVQQKCSVCHSLERVYAYAKTEAGWRDYVSLMRAKDPAIMNDREALQAVGYLTKNLGIDEARMDVQVGMKIILEKCHKCHTIERVFTFKKTQAEWAQTIELMRSFDPYLLSDSESRQVNYYLSKILAKQKTES